MNEEEKKIESEIYKHLTGSEPTELDEKYAISFFVNNSGVVDVHVDWPEKMIEGMEDSIAYLLYAINSGSVKNLCVQSLNESAAQDGSLLPYVQLVVEKWLNIENNGKDRPFISPLNTLK